MSERVLDDWAYDTERLKVAPWHDIALQFGLDLTSVVAELLTARTTVALPASWRGEFSFERAEAWIEERDGESPTLLVIEISTGHPVGLLILAEVPIGEVAIDQTADTQTPVDLRIGYVIAERSWGQGLATELLGGLINWARARPAVHTLTGGVDLTNQASAHVLEKAGFRQVSNEDSRSATFQLSVDEDSVDEGSVEEDSVDEGSEWDQYAGNWDEDAAARAYSTSAFSSLQDLLTSSGIELDRAKVIDFGCGTGLLTAHLISAGAVVEAVDTSRAMLEVLQAKIVDHNWATISTSTELPPIGPTFDLVVCSSVCAFLDDYPTTVEELVRRLRPGGLCVQWDWERIGDDPHGLTRDEIQDALTRVGLVDVVVETGFSVEVHDQKMSPLIGWGRTPDPSVHD